MIAQSTVHSLSNFIDAAARSRNYPASTAAALRTALRLFEKELNDAERSSAQTFSENLDTVYQSAAGRHQKTISAASMYTYYRRMKTLLADYQRYGTDPTAMATWNRPKRAVRVPAPNVVVPAQVSRHEPAHTPSPVVPDARAAHRLEIALRPDVKATLILPTQVTAEDATIIKAFVDASVQPKTS